MNVQIKYQQALKISAVAYHVYEKSSSAIATKIYGTSKEKWKVISAPRGDIKTIGNIMDGNPSTIWMLGNELHKLPQEITIDMGTQHTITGFKYFPQQVGSTLYLISKYEFYTSMDNLHWFKQSEGEFSNIKNNPIEQVITFKAVQSRYLRFVAKSAIGNENSVAIGEIDVL